MDDDQEHENRNRTAGLTWWVRYAFVPVAVAVIAGFSAVRAADLLKPVPTSQPVESAPVATVSIPSSDPAIGQDQSVSPAEELVQATALPAAITATAVVPTAAPTAVPTLIPSAAPTATPEATVPLPEAAVPQATQPADAAEAILGVHVVRSGEQLFCIGRGYGVTPQAIAQANHLADPSRLRVGQKLVIPDRKWRNVANGVVCDPQFPSPYAGRAEIVSVGPKAPHSGGGQPAGDAPAEIPASTEAPQAPTEVPPTEMPPTYPPPEG